MRRTGIDLHGGYIYGDTIKYDFSANLNPLGMPESARKAARKAIAESDCYPDPFCSALNKRIKEQWGVRGDMIVFGNGADDLIYRIVYAEKPKRAVIVTPTFTEYAAALENVDCEIIEHRLSEENGFTLDETILDKLTDDVDMLFLCNPNNPTGRLIDLSLLKRVNKACERGICFVLDECFIELAENGATHSLTASELGYNTIILRAFTKTYAMAGLRLGYAVFGSKDTALLTALAGQHWSVSSQDEYRPDSIPVIIKSPESDFVYSVAWNQGEWPMGGTFIVALEDGLWKIDNLLSPAETESESKADSPKRKFSPLFDYSQPVQDNLCFDPEVYEFTEERLADAKSIPEYVPEIP